jgi:hypothetical protein
MEMVAELELVRHAALAQVNSAVLPMHFQARAQGRIAMLGGFTGGPKA